MLFILRHYLTHCGHGHDLTSVAQLSVINIADIEVLSIKHCRQSTFAETPSTTRHSRDARQRRASMLVYLYLYIYFRRAVILCSQTPPAACLRWTRNLALLQRASGFCHGSTVIRAPSKGRCRRSAVAVKPAEGGLLC